MFGNSVQRVKELIKGHSFDPVPYTYWGWSDCNALGSYGAAWHLLTAGWLDPQFRIRYDLGEKEFDPNAIADLLQMPQDYAEAMLVWLRRLQHGRPLWKRYFWMGLELCGPHHFYMEPIPCRLPDLALVLDRSRYADYACDAIDDIMKRQIHAHLEREMETM